MYPQACQLKLTPIAWSVVLNGLALVAFTVSPFAAEYPFAVLGIVTFLAVQLLLPACRPNLDSPLCPGNVAQAFFWSQLVLVPLLIGFYGISLGTLPRLPSSEALNTAIVLRVVGYVAFCLAFQCFCKSPKRDASDSFSDGDSGFPLLTILVFAGIGLVGWLLFYGGVGGFVDFATSPLAQREREQQETTLGGAAGNILRHFLGFACVWAWSSWVGSTNRRGGLAVVIVTGILIVLLLIANFSYNRGTLLAPILALAAAYSSQVRRISLSLVALAGAVILAGAFTMGWYRSTNLQLADVSSADLGTSWGDNEMVDFLQIYASGPQLTGYLIEELEMTGKSFHGATIVPSMLYPVPIIGKPFRESSGVHLFNEMIYGDPEVLDQNIPYDGELYMNFNIAGVILGYFLLGWLQATWHSRFVHARRAIESYVWLILAIWTLFPGSLPVLSQMCLYSFWPIYAYFFVTRFIFRLDESGDQKKFFACASGSELDPCFPKVGVST